MKVRPILFYAWMIFVLSSIYVSVNTKVEYVLWTIWGHSFGFSALSTNIPMKIVFFVLLFASFIQANNIKKEEHKYIIPNSEKPKKKRQNFISLKKTVNA